MKKSKLRKLLARATAALEALQSAPAKPAEPQPAKPRRRRVSVEALAASYAKRTPPKLPEGRLHPFQPARPTPGVVPEGEAVLAMDEAGPVNSSTGWAGGFYNYAFNEGVTFLGYSYLSELAQRPEYRRMVDTIAKEATREWIEFESVGEDEATKTSKNEKIRAITDEMDRLDVRGCFCQIAKHDGYFGRAHLFIDTGVDLDDREGAAELKLNIGTGRDETSKTKVPKDSLRALRTIEPVWTYPQAYNATNPLRPNWYRPERWYVMGQEVHVSRLMCFVSREVPDLLKPAYSFGGLSLTQMAKPYVDNWLQIRQSVSDIASAFSTFVLKGNLAESMQLDGEEIFLRAELFNNLRNNRGLFMLDKETEDFANVSAPLGGLDLLQAQAQEHQASVSAIPLVKLLGISPHGLNATAEPELRAFYEEIHSYQEAFFRPNLTKVVDFVQLSLFGEVDQDITYKFVPLWSLTEKEEAEVRYSAAQTDQLYVDMGVLDPQEVREKVVNDPASPYVGLDPEDVPDLLEEEEQGLMPKGGSPKIQAEEVEEEIDAEPKKEAA